jgi:hypothetical protein
MSSSTSGFVDYRIAVQVIGPSSAAVALARRMFSENLFVTHQNVDCNSFIWTATADSLFVHKPAEPHTKLDVVGLKPVLVRVRRQR